MSEPDTGSALTPPASLLAAAVSTAEWTAALSILRDYTTLQGTAELQPHTIWSGFDLGAWGRRVRGVHNKGLLSRAQIAELEALPGWTWKYNLKTLPWDTGIAALRDYAVHYGLAVVPRKTVWKGLELDEWVARVPKCTHRASSPPTVPTSSAHFPGGCGSRTTGTSSQQTPSPHTSGNHLSRSNNGDETEPDRPTTHSGRPPTTTEPSSTVGAADTHTSSPSRPRRSPTPARQQQGEDSQMGNWMSTGISTRSQMRPRPIVHLITDNGDGYRLWCTGSRAIESPAQTENWRHCDECKKLAVENYEAEILGESEVGRYATFLPGQT